MVEHRWWRGFVSRGTIISGLISLVFWGLTLGWAAGIILLALLFVHELGHILGARARKMTIQGAPIFVPGLGAFVRVAPTANVWDEVVMVLGGPVVGGVAALLAGVAGVIWQVPALAFAGSFGLILNLSNLLPLQPFDGGRLAARTGWLGYLPTLALGGLVLTFTIMGRGGPLVGLFACIGLYWGYRTMRSGLVTPRTAQAAIFLLHLASFALLLIAYIGISRSEDRTIPSAGQLTVPSDGNRLMIGFGLAALILFGGSSLAHQLAFRPGCDRTLRYTLLALAGWPSFLFGHARIIPGLWCLFAQLLGLPGLTWLTAYIRRLAAGGHPAAGYLCAYGYDFLRGDEADRWLDAQAPTIRAAGDRAVLAVATALPLLGYQARAFRWGVTAYAGSAPDALSWQGATLVSAGLGLAGRPEEGLPYARAALAIERNVTTLGNLGELLHELGQQTEAESLLRESLQRSEYYSFRLVLAKVFAAQGRYAEAIAAADQVLHTHQGPWAEIGPTAAEVRTWIQGWLIAAARDAAAPARASTTPEADLVAH